MAKTGRPKTHGAKQGWTLIRDTIAFGAFIKARRDGVDYDFALKAGVGAVHDFDPSMSCSTSTVKRVLKEFMPEGGEEMLKVTEITVKTEAPNGTVINKTIRGIGFEPRVKFPHPSNRKK